MPCSSSVTADATETNPMGEVGFPAAPSRALRDKARLAWFGRDSMRYSSAVLNPALVG
jgi:hypothetical protein